MSRTYNKHHKNWNTPKRMAKFYGNKTRRRHGKKLIDNMKQNGPENNELPIDIPKHAGDGDIWIYD